MRFPPLIPAAVGLALAACAAPADLPLPAKPGLAESLNDLRHDGINPATPLTVTQVAGLAVRNNPDLRAVRAQHGVAQAQVLQAGLLPNPQFAGGSGRWSPDTARPPPTPPASPRIFGRW